MKQCAKAVISILVILAVLNLSAVSLSAENVRRATYVEHHESNDHDFHFGFDGLTIDHINIDFNEDHDLTVTNKEENTYFMITEKYDLFINGNKIETDAKQKALCKDMYINIDKVIREAKDLGWEGAKIGMEGAKIGLHALVGVLKLLSPNYNVEDLEEEIEMKAELLEKKAEKLEVRAENIEDLVRFLDDLSDTMRVEIPELQQLSWF